jgi:hypothetical protein
MISYPVPVTELDAAAVRVTGKPRSGVVSSAESDTLDGGSGMVHCPVGVTSLEVSWLGLVT